MILSLKHLNKYLPNIKLDAKEVEKALNNLGLEVESVSPFSDVKGLVFAKVLEVSVNPNSDKLDVVKVLTKQGEYTIQTNNRILKPGDLTICFPTGASKGNFVFADKEIKGVLSQGMFGAWSEIGYDNSLLSYTDSILVLSNDFATLEDDAMELLGLNDTLIEISVTANRNDANSYYVLARELASYFDTDFISILKETPSSFTTQFTVNKNKAQHLSFTEVKGKKETTLYEKMLLAKNGIDTKFDWAVNLTNLTLINYGVPAHVYDATKLENNLSADYYLGKLVILGNKEVELNNVLTIFANNKPVSVACAMGLEDTKATEQTNDYLFEVGVFKSTDVRHSSKELKLISNSAAQGARTITPELASLAVKFIRSYCNDLQVSNTIGEFEFDSYKEIKIDNEKLKVYSNKSDNQLVEFIKAKDQLSKLGFIFEVDTVKVPNYRYDVNLFEDVMEELFRFYSYSNFKEEIVKNVPLITQSKDRTKNIISGMGYSEVRTFTLVSKEKADFKVLDLEETVGPLLTFVSKEREYVRNSIIVSLQEVVEYNQKRKLNSINIFEVGMIGNSNEVLGLTSTTKSFFEMKQDIINFAKLDLEFVPLKDNALVHPNASAKIVYIDQNTCAQVELGWLGKIHPSIDKTNAFYAELFTDVIKNIRNNEAATKFKSVNTEPYKTLDLTFELANGEYIQDKINQIKSVSDCFSIDQIDDYKKENSHNVTLRITGSSEQIEKIDSHFNN
ncbi:phenylalanine--tRNA ligase subunit beta [Mycoplasma sp. 2045]|uniref:phenylalanine--tRNA ligase subunit beta n=1 Tax=Mycoplasma sp. 2045 TaxID=2967301 RepID=UPI00211B9BA5|nr:phenylalanine--tRNA ligase subunit beta [Mycoplasma sp. 2045]UUM20684.1 phenylalanine--tRNA ligase subunit beta [Mycoplasma sp. 2045]